MARRVHRSMQGKIVDMELLASRNELAPAVGNAKVNARGDELGPGGLIVRRREDIVAEYYENNPQAVINEQPKLAVQKAGTTTAPAEKPKAKTQEPARRSTVKKEVLDEVKEDKTDS